VTAGRQLKVAIKNLLGFKGVRQVRVLAGPARGVSISLDFSGQTPLYLGMYEWELHGFLRERLPRARLVFDIGGHIGYDTLLFAANTSGRVVTCEPDPACEGLLRANLDRNPELRDRVTVVPSAVCSHNGDGATTIDGLSEAMGQPDLIKMDIDGGELDALAGGLATLREGRPDLIVETHSKRLEDECGALLVECGYRPIIKHNRKIWREPRGGAEHNRWLLASGSRDSTP